MEKHIYHYYFNRENQLKCRMLPIFDRCDNWIFVSDDGYCQRYDNDEFEKILPNKTFISMKELNEKEFNKLWLHFMYCEVNKKKIELNEYREEYKRNIKQINQNIKCLEKQIRRLENETF